MNYGQLLMWHFIECGEQETSHHITSPITAFKVKYSIFYQLGIGKRANWQHFSAINFILQI